MSHSVLNLEKSNLVWSRYGEPDVSLGENSDHHRSWLPSLTWVCRVRAVGLDDSGNLSEFYWVTVRVSINPLVCHGKPVITGTRVLISTILGALAAGDSPEMLLEDYSGITREDISAALEFAREVSDFQVSAYETVA